MEVLLTIHFHFDTKFVLIHSRLNRSSNSTFNIMAYLGISVRYVIMFSKTYMHSIFDHAIKFVKTYFKVHQKVPQRTYISKFSRGRMPPDPPTTHCSRLRRSPHMA